MEISYINQRYIESFHQNIELMHYKAVLEITDAIRVAPGDRIF